MALNVHIIIDKDNETSVPYIDKSDGKKVYEGPMEIYDELQYVDIREINSIYNDVEALANIIAKEVAFNEDYEKFVADQILEIMKASPATGKYFSDLIFNKAIDILKTEQEKFNKRYHDFKLSHPQESNDS